MLTDDIDIRNPDVRRFIVDTYGLAGFCWVYLSHHFYQEPADFHPELISVFESIEEELVEVIGFRGSAKSTYGSLAVPLYLALEHKHDFIIPVSDTGAQMKLNIENIKYELESNEMILKDYGVMYNPEKNWSSTSLLLLNGVLIFGRSRGQKMRGLKHRQYRPQVVIVDDPEDLEWVKKKENRDKTERWFNSEVIPAQQEDRSKLILIGNMLHKDALMARVEKKKRADGTALFYCLKFPLIDESGHCTWRGKYPTDEAIQKQKEKVGATAWAREYQLKIIAEEDQVIAETDIHRYPNEILTKRDDHGNLPFKIIDAGVGTDLAISENQKADCTAMVSGLKVEWNGRHILIKPRPVNERIDFDTTLKRAVLVGEVMPYGAKFYVEDVHYQRAALQGMKKKGLSVFPMRPITDKKARLESVATYIKDGTVLFPEHGCEDLITQLVGFGSEEHDDLVDALVYLIMGLINRKMVRGIGKVDQL